MHPLTVTPCFLLPLVSHLPLIYFLSLYYLFYTFHINVVIKYIVFCDWFLFTSYNVFKVHSYCCLYWYFFSCLRLNNFPFCGYTVWFISSSTDEHCGCFPLLAITNNALLKCSWTRFCVDICFRLSCE